MTNLEVFEKQKELIEMIDKLKEKEEKNNKKPYIKTSYIHLTW